MIDKRFTIKVLRNHIEGSLECCRMLVGYFAFNLRKKPIFNPAIRVFYQALYVWGMAAKANRFNTLAASPNIQTSLHMVKVLFCWSIQFNVHLPVTKQERAC